jgi:DNA helicase-2/ATP-dependent DNA helicase PcrA
LLEAAREARQIESLSKRSTGLLGKFVAMFDRLAAVAGSPVEEILGMVLTETAYAEAWRKSENEEDQDRLANIEELLTVARDFDERHVGTGRLEAFLEESCLVNETDDWEDGVDRVTLMTLHASKGLEFPVVYLTAAEEGLLPHERSRDNPEQLEEERRLMFVGITRAQEELQLSLAQYRDYRGRRKMTVPSHFLMELPRDAMALEAPEPDASFAAETYQLEPAHVEPVLARRESKPPSSVTANVHLTTAAELLAGGPQAAISPEAFHQGMLVRHPQYGLGHIIAVSGSGQQRQATVDFGTHGGRKRIALVDSPLRPMKDSS